MASKEIDEMAQVLRRCLPEGMAWVLVAMPAHEPGSHPGSGCPIEFTSNVLGVKGMLTLLEGASGMLATGNHQPLETRVLEKLN